MVTTVISELKSISRLKIFRETEPRCRVPYYYCNFRVFLTTYWVRFVLRF